VLFAVEPRLLPLFLRTAGRVVAQTAQTAQTIEPESWSRVSAASPCGFAGTVALE
jgi:hypothetical protein